MAHVIRLAHVVRDDVVDFIRLLGFLGRHGFRFLAVVARDIGKQFLDLGEAFLFGLGVEMGVARDFGMGAGTAKVFLRDFFAQYRLDDFRSGNEHLGNLVHHENEVCQGRGIYSTAGARAEDYRKLRDDPRCLGVTVEDFPVTGQSADPFLDTGSPRVVDADQRHLHIDGMVHDLANLHGVHEAERPSGHREVLGIDADRAAVDRTRAGNHPVASQIFLVHSEISGRVLDEEVQFLERTRIQNAVNPFTGGEFPAFFLLGNGLFATTSHGRLFALPQIGAFFLVCRHCDEV